MATNDDPTPAGTETLDPTIFNLGVAMPLEPVMVPLPVETRPASPQSEPEPWREGLQKLQAQLAEQREILLNIAARLQETEADKLDQHRNREALFEKIESSKLGFQFQLVRPMIQRVATMYDLATSWEQDPPQDPAAMKQHIEVLAVQFRETLQLFGIEIIEPKQGDAFDRKFHHVMEVVPTGDATQHEKVAGTLQHGFLYFGQQERTNALVPIVVRPARVRSWKYDAKLANQESGIRGQESGVTNQESGTPASPMPGS